MTQATSMELSQSYPGQFTAMKQEMERDGNAQNQVESDPTRPWQTPSAAYPEDARG